MQASGPRIIKHEAIRSDILCLLPMEREWTILSTENCPPVDDWDIRVKRFFLENLLLMQRHHGLDVIVRAFDPTVDSWWGLAAQIDRLNLRISMGLLTLLVGPIGSAEMFDWARVRCPGILGPETYMALFNCAADYGRCDVIAHLIHVTGIDIVETSALLQDCLHRIVNYCFTRHCYFDNVVVWIMDLYGEFGITTMGVDCPWIIACSPEFISENITFLVSLELDPLILLAAMSRYNRPGLFRLLVLENVLSFTWEPEAYLTPVVYMQETTELLTDSFLAIQWLMPDYMNAIYANVNSPIRVSMWQNLARFGNRTMMRYVRHTLKLNLPPIKTFGDLIFDATSRHISGHHTTVNFNWLCQVYGQPRVNVPSKFMTIALRLACKGLTRPFRHMVDLMSEESRANDIYFSCEFVVERINAFVLAESHTGQELLVDYLMLNHVASALRIRELLCNALMAGRYRAVDLLIQRFRISVGMSEIQLAIQRAPGPDMSMLFGHMGLAFEKHRTDILQLLNLLIADWSTWCDTTLRFESFSSESVRLMNIAKLLDRPIDFMHRHLRLAHQTNMARS